MGLFLARPWVICSFLFFTLCAHIFHETWCNVVKNPISYFGSCPISPIFCVNVQKSVQNNSFLHKTFEKFLVFLIWFFVHPSSRWWSGYKMPPVLHRGCPKRFFESVPFFSENMIEFICNNRFWASSHSSSTCSLQENMKGKSAGFARGTQTTFLAGEAIFTCGRRPAGLLVTHRQKRVLLSM